MSKLTFYVEIMCTRSLNLGSNIRENQDATWLGSSTYLTIQTIMDGPDAGMWTSKISWKMVAIVGLLILLLSLAVKNQEAVFCPVDALHFFWDF